MYQLRLTLETPAANLALDEALLDAAGVGELPGDVLRLWEPASPFVVLGRSSRESEVNLAACHADGIPVLRRCSGGATIVAGPGCLMYAMVLAARGRSELRGVDRAHSFVLDRLTATLQSLAAGVSRAGTSDLVLAAANREPPRKFSGNSLRLKRDHLLYHGTILYDFPLERLARWLGSPARMPDYRSGRAHYDFVANFPAARERVVAALVEAWQAHEPLAEWPRERTDELAVNRYASLDD